MVALFALPALVGVVVVLGLLAVAAPLLPQRGIPPATAGLSLLALLLALALVAAGGQSQLLAGSLAIDPLGAVFLLPPAVAGLAVAGGLLGRAAPAALPGFVAASLLVVLAGDARFAVLGVALFATASSDWVVRPAALAGIFLLAAAFATLSLGGGQSFAAMRAVPPDGWRATLVLALTLLGVAPLVGWAPWHRPFLALDATGLPLPVLSPAIGLYLCVRVLADLCGPATPGWWGLPLLLLGAGSAGAGLIAALRAPTFGGILAGLSVQHGGWMLSGLGVAAIARGADLLPLATLALGGTLLHALNYTAFASLASLSTGAAAIGAGSQTLDRLGGLAGRMPVVAIGMLVAGLSLAFLPGSAGFASGWMLLQALFAAPRAGGLALQLVVAAVVAAMALSAGFAAIAVIRLGGVAFLGRPRSPRAAAAEDASLAQRAGIIGMAVLCGLLGLFPGVALRLCGMAQHWVTSAGLDGQGDWTGIRTQIDSPGYGPLGIVIMVGIVLAVIAMLSRTGRLPAAQPVPIWEDGFTAPPPWMPFGDPATQLTPATLTATLPTRPLRLPSMPRVRLEVTWPSVTLRHAPVVVLILAVLLLLLVAGFGPV
ncbi:proton-conducting transporter membrane subunit [Acidisphaera sp. L21]|uniref:proton-conducting transporter transmembrane domain-containing protein n=1 Tax=Acidisphaera sp. L21 TaxID=1641851 RepID=UPI00131B3046|nr:proton-conducting transporter membrane subunit [Acidisphaera sp. L21]